MVEFEDDDYYTYRRNERCCKDHDQRKCIEDWSAFTSPESSSIKKIIEEDNAVAFKSLLEHSAVVLDTNDARKLDFSGCEVCPYNILGKICRLQAFNCAKVLLSSEVGRAIDLNIQNCYGSYPMHDAALSLSPRLVELFLSHGARHEIQYWDSVTGQGIYPLEYALESLSNKNLIHWSPKISSYKLVIALCLPQMKEALQTISLLAAVEKRESMLSDVVLRVVRRGQVTQLAALLLVARDNIMSGVKFRGNSITSGSLLFPTFVVNELASLINYEYALMGRKEHAKSLELCLEKKELTIYILGMLKFFKVAGRDIESYYKSITANVTKKQVAEDVEKLLCNAGLALNSEDTDLSDVEESDSEHVSLYSKAAPLIGSVFSSIFKQARDESTGFQIKPTPARIFCAVQNPTCTTSQIFHRIVGSRFSHNQNRAFTSHAGQRPAFYMSGLPKVFGKMDPPNRIGATERRQILRKRLALSFLISTLRRTAPR